jgi:hypothetical protein
MAIDIAEQIPSMTDAQLKTFKDNVTRLQVSGADRQKVEAERLLPLILAELAGRKPAPAAEAPKRAAAPRKKAAPKKKAAASE